MQKRHLRMVTDANNNKDYVMEDNQNGTFTVQWGRYGASMQSTTYPITLWDKKLNEKLNKGYRDISNGVTEHKRGSFKAIGIQKMDEMFNRLLAISNLQIANNYSQSVEDVTGIQLSEAQSIIDSISIQVRSQDIVNNHLIDLFHVLPRKMKNVRSFLWDGQDIGKIIQREQDLLDTLSSQVGTLASPQSDISILDAIGISVYECKPHELKQIQSMMGSSRHKIVNAFRVHQSQYESNFESYRTQERKNMLLWHGSRSQNWIGILKEGLRIRPSNAITTGSMFGHGNYFADRVQKSLGYTSISGSHWSNGSDDRGYLGIFNFNMGKSLTVDRHERWMESLNLDKIQKRGYDSLHALSGYDLRNPEMIVYHPHQCCIQFIVEVS